MVIGRNIWGCPEITKALNAFKSVVHDQVSPEKAMQLAGSEPEMPRPEFDIFGLEPLQ